MGSQSHAVDIYSAGITALCSQTKSCSSQQSDFVKNLVSTCEIEVKALDCEGLAKKYPEMQSSLRKCDFKSQCQQSEENLVGQDLACLRGYKNALVDTGIALKDMAVSLGDFVESSWDSFKSNIKKKNEFIRQCQKSIACKRDLVKDDHRYNRLSDEELGKLSASFLYVESQDMKAWKASLDRAPGRAPVRPPPRDDSLTPDQRHKMNDLMAMVGGQIKEQYHKFSCYKPLIQAEMACYAVGNVIDPTILFGAAFKGARLAVAAGKAIKAEEALRVEGTAAKSFEVMRAGRLTRENLIKDFLTYSPTSVADNEKWIALAEKGVNSKVRFLDVENSQLKTLNDTLKDKNLVTSLTNYHKKLLFEKIEVLKKEFPNLKVEQYSDFKSSRFAFSGDIPKEFETKLQKAFKETNDEFTTYLKAEKIVRDGDASKDWFRAGVGQSAEQANVAARYSRLEAENKLQNYSQAKLTTELTSKLNSIEKSRQTLRTELAKTSMVDGNTLHADAFDIVRKNAGDDKKVAEALKQRFALSSLPASTVKELQIYVKSSDEFSPGIFVPKREVANLNEAAKGGFSADVIGLGASNIKGTAEALARSKNLDQVLEETRKAEKAVTVEFQAQKKYFEDVVRRSVDPGKLKTICSGDDCVAIAVKPLNESDKKNILNGLADSKYSGKFRLAFIPEGVTDVSARNTLSTHGESVEKILRSSLSTVMEPRKMQGLTFGLDMNTQTVNSGSIKLLIGEAPGVRLTTQERALIQKKFEQSLQELNQGFSSKGITSTYRAN
ncbi:hypothetical protein [Bdellovibrio svalbardensis]|uniref:hypothetical protein n=1 Tax=Bdellovibrio svalbardensis TaxID=2972972 RepID=UPI0024088032|nr:hypothetical protein [Bdellovibrio svalbardensis]